MLTRTQLDNLRVILNEGTPHDVFGVVEHALKNPLAIPYLADFKEGSPQFVQAVHPEDEESELNVRRYSLMVHSYGWEEIDQKKDRKSIVKINFNDLGRSAFTHCDNSFLDIFTSIHGTNPLHLQFTFGSGEGINYKARIYESMTYASRNARKLVLGY